jgi:hypothetical protein
MGTCTYQPPTDQLYNMHKSTDEIRTDSEGEVGEEQIQDAMEVVKSLNEETKPKGRKMKLEIVNLSFASATP